MNLNKNYYEVLGVSRTSDEATVKQAYRNLSKTHHPDKGGNEEKFKEVNEAFSVLGSKDKKQKYDRDSPNGANYNPNSFNGGFWDFSSNNFDFQGFGGGFNSFFEDLDIKTRKEVSLKDIYNDNSITLDFTRNVPCSRCDGMGVEESKDSDECSICEGKGVRDNGYHKLSCEYCNGSGTIHTKQCTKCTGRKLNAKKESITVDNTHVLREEQSMAYGGMGNFSTLNRRTKGNLIITLVPERQSVYRREGDNLLISVDVDFVTAILGGSFEHEHLDGKTYSIKIPASTNNGNKFKLSGKGMFRQDKRSRGDLIFLVNLVIDYDKVDIEKIKALVS
jgi:molecular chaperone DnaJ